MAPGSKVGHKLSTEGAAQTQELGARLGRAFPGDAVVYVSGGLGVGKSTFARGLLGGIGVTEPVPSPSYALAQIYPSRVGTLCHVDLFRSTYAREWLDAGLDETIAGCSLCLIEWPDRGAMLPPADLHAAIADAGEQSRSIEFVDMTAGGSKWFQAAFA